MIKLFNTYKIVFLGTGINILLLFSVNIVNAQNPVVENIIEDLASNSELNDLDYSTFVEDLSFYMENPLNLNEATAEKLENLHFLTEYQINNLVNYIAQRGSMATIYELQLIEGFNPIVIEKILPFVTVKETRTETPLEFKKVLKYGRHQLIFETGFPLQTAKAYKHVEPDTATGRLPSRYQGDKMNYKFKYKFHYKDRIFAGISAEKDAGEAFVFNDNIYGFDFYSAHFQINDIGKIKQINAGDFHAHFGQGLIMWTGFGMGKSSDVMNVRKRGKTLRYYSSTNENNFLRGLGTTVKLGKFELTSFISYKKIDATIDDADTLENETDKIVSLRNSGYHRTETELRNRKIIGELIAGSKLSVGFSNVKMALNFVGYKYERPIEASTKPHKMFDLQGDNNFNASFDYLLYYKKMNLFGEVAIDKNARIAVLNGLSTALASQLSFSILHRYYQKDYNANYAVAFGENSKAKNEHGMYYGLEFYPFSKIKLSAYADIFKFAWLKYRVDAPSSGYEYLLNLIYSPTRTFSVDLKYKSALKGINTQEETKALNLVENKQTNHYRLHIGYQVSEFIRLGSRIAVSEFEQLGKKNYGYMLYQDAKFILKHLPLTFYVRYSFFDADYDNRIYAYENDLLYSFSVPSFSGKGNSFYVMGKYDVSSFLTFRVKYKQSFFPTKEVLGTGLSSILGNVKSYLKFQIVLKL